MWEKRLARYLTFQMRTNTGTEITRAIRDMLEELHLPRNETNPEKTRQRFEKAMNRLRDDQVITHWQYEENTLPAERKWLDTWLSHLVTISASPLKDGQQAQEKGQEGHKLSNHARDAGIFWTVFWARSGQFFPSSKKLQSA